MPLPVAAADIGAFQVVARRRASSRRVLLRIQCVRSPCLFWSAPHPTAALAAGRQHVRRALRGASGAERGRGRTDGEGCACRRRSIALLRLPTDRRPRDGSRQLSGERQSGQGERKASRLDPQAADVPVITMSTASATAINSIVIIIIISRSSSSSGGGGRDDDNENNHQKQCFNAQ